MGDRERYGSVLWYYRWRKCFLKCLRHCVRILIIFMDFFSLAKHVYLKSISFGLNEKKLKSSLQ